MAQQEAERAKFLVDKVSVDFFSSCRFIKPWMGIGKVMAIFWTVNDLPGLQGLNSDL